MSMLRACCLAFLAFLALPACAFAAAPLPAFWVVALCQRDDARCLPLLRDAYARAANAEGGTYAPITYCVPPQPPDAATVRGDFLRVARSVPAMLDAGIKVDRMEAFVLQRVNPCGLSGGG